MQSSFRNGHSRSQHDKNLPIFEYSCSVAYACSHYMIALILTLTFVEETAQPFFHFCSMVWRIHKFIFSIEHLHNKSVHVRRYAGNDKPGKEKARKLRLHLKRMICFLKRIQQEWEEERHNGESLTMLITNQQRAIQISFATTTS